MKRCWLVECVKGDALFLDAERAYQYATKHHGTITTLFDKEWHDALANDRPSLGAQQNNTEQVAQVQAQKECHHCV